MASLLYDWTYTNYWITLEREEYISPYLLPRPNVGSLNVQQDLPIRRQNTLHNGIVEQASLKYKLNLMLHWSMSKIDEQLYLPLFGMRKWLEEEVSCIDPVTQWEGEKLGNWEKQTILRSRSRFRVKVYVWYPYNVKYMFATGFPGIIAPPTIYK